MRACQVCERPAEDGLYCGQCEKVTGDAMMDLKAEFGV